MRAVIIEDEQDARELLESLIVEFFPRIDILGTASSIESAVEVIKQNEPELLFLDIELQHGTAFDLLALLPDLDCHIIFTTAYDTYAIKAFDYNTLHYLLKPYSVIELEKALHKLTSYDKKSSSKIISSLKKEWQIEKPPKISFPTHHGLLLIDADLIVRIEAEGSYCYILTSDQRKELVSKSLREIEKIINRPNFLRAHRSHLVNAAHIEKIIRDEGGYLIMSNGNKVPMSRYKKDEILAYFSN